MAHGYCLSTLGIEKCESTINPPQAQLRLILILNIEQFLDANLGPSLISKKEEPVSKSIHL